LIEIVAAISLIASTFIQALHVFYSLGYTAYESLTYTRRGVASNNSFYSSRYISIIIAVKDEDPWILRRTLESCLAIQWPRDRVEILVVSDDPVERREELRKAVKDLQSGNEALKLIFREKPGGGGGQALNLAIKEAKGDIVLLLDVDTKPSPGMVRKAVEMINTGCDAVVFRWRGYYAYSSRLAKALSTAMEFIVGSLYRGRSGLGYQVIPLGSGTAYRKDVILKVGGWDIGIVQDDYWMGIKLFGSGRRVCYCDDEHVDVMVTSTYKAFKIQQSRWSFGAVQAIKKGIKIISGSRAPLWKKVELVVYGLQYIPTIAIALSIYIYPILLIFHRGSDPIESILYIFALWLLVSMIYIVRYIQIVIKRQDLRLLEAIKRLGTSSAATSALSFHIAFSQIQGILFNKYRYVITPKGSREIQLKRADLSEIPEILSMIILTIGVVLSLARGYLLSTTWLALLLSAYIYTLLVIIGIK
jgi:cellulose synthase/poly-beta-1,6-N-acetylglucosamine synthase-like glycosyltransferase